MPLEFTDEPIIRAKPAKRLQVLSDRSLTSIATDGVSEGERHNAFIKLAGLLRGKDIPRGVALSLLRGWNETEVDPPFTNAELNDEFHASFDKWVPGEGAPEATEEEGFHALSVAEIYAAADAKGNLKWLVPDMIAQGCSHIISAPSAHGKTWWVLTLGRAIASGTDWMNMPIAHGSVLLIDEEMGAVLNARRMRQLQFPTDIPFFTLTQEGFRLDSMDAIAWLCRFIEANEIVMVIIDSLRRVHNQDENSNSEMRRLLAPINAISATGAAVVVLHHDRKKGAESDVTHEKSSGASDIIAQCSMAFGATRTKDTYTLECRKSRIVADTDVPKVSFRLEDTIGTRGEKVTLVIPVDEDVRKANADRTAENVVLGFLKHNPNATTNAIRDGVKQQGNATSAALKRLAEAGRIEMTPGPNRSKTYSITSYEADADTTYGEYGQ